jgi:hypothetical protein
VPQGIRDECPCRPRFTHICWCTTDDSTAHLTESDPQRLPQQVRVHSSRAAAEEHPVSTCHQGMCACMHAYSVLCCRSRIVNDAFRGRSSHLVHVCLYAQRLLNSTCAQELRVLLFCNTCYNTVLASPSLVVPAFLLFSWRPLRRSRLNTPCDPCSSSSVIVPGQQTQSFFVPATAHACNTRCR